MARLKQTQRKRVGSVPRLPVDVVAAIAAEVDLLVDPLLKIVDTTSVLRHRCSSFEAYMEVVWHCSEELCIIVDMVLVPVDESPAFLLYQDWALGLIFLKICTRLEELKSVGCIETASRSCKVVADYVIASSDPLITT
ncbi:hypothetical protein AgCh_009083 [Apium graveolens]